jgi:hypothetical protein
MWLWLNWQWYIRVCLEAPRKVTGMLGQDYQPGDLNFYLVSPQYKTQVLSIELLCLFLPFTHGNIFIVSFEQC